MNRTHSNASLQLERALARTLVWVTLSLLPLASMADGGVVRLRETQGPFVVTIFSLPEAANGLPTDVTVMVQRRNSGAIVMDATVDLSLVAPAGARLNPGDVLCGLARNLPSPWVPVVLAEPASFPATHAQAVNKLLYGAPLTLRAAGNWQLRATVRQGDEEAHVACVLPVGMPPNKVAALWPCLALPPIAIALFAVNQWLRFKLERRTPHFAAHQTRRPSGSRIALREYAKH